MEEVEISIEEIAPHDNPVVKKHAQKMWEKRQFYDKIYVVNSDTMPSYKYLVGKREDGRWECTCLDYVFRRSVKNEECKHIDRVKSNEKNLVPLWDKERTKMGAIISTLSNPISVEDILPAGYEADLWVSPEEQNSLLNEEILESLATAGVASISTEEEISEEDYIAEDEDEYEL